MADTKTPSPDGGADKAPKMTKEDAAKRVRRPVVDKAGKAATVSIKASEVLSFRDYGTHVVVVTIDGCKFSSADVADVADQG